MFTQDGPYIDRLPSSHDGLGDGFGPSDIAWLDGTIEGGGCARGLADHPAGFLEVKRGSFRYVADISAYPVANEPLTASPTASRTRCWPTTAGCTWCRRTTTACCA